jgi:hypothetical protein
MNLNESKSQLSMATSGIKRTASTGTGTNTSGNSKAKTTPAQARPSNLKIQLPIAAEAPTLQPPLQPARTPQQHNYQQQLYPYFDSSSWASTGTMSMYGGGSGSRGGGVGMASITPRGYIGCPAPLSNNASTGLYTNHHHYPHQPAPYPSYPTYHPSVIHQQHHSAWTTDSFTSTNHPSSSIMPTSTLMTSYDAGKASLPMGPESSRRSKGNLRTADPNESSNVNPRGYINRTIMDAAVALDLPPGGCKFANVHWSSALRLFYRWKTTVDGMEAFILSSATAMSLSASLPSSSSNKEHKDGEKSTTMATPSSSARNDVANNAGNSDACGSVTKKSVKAFVDKVLQRESKRRQFSIHWKDCGLKEFFEKQNKEEKKPLVESSALIAPGMWKTVYHGESSSSFFVPFDHPQVGAMLDDYFSGRKRSRDYVEAERHAKVQRQLNINHLWDVVTGGLPRTRLNDLQRAIEAPYKTKIILHKKDGGKMTHEVVLDGFGGAKYKPITDVNVVQSNKEIAIQLKEGEEIDDGDEEEETNVKNPHSSTPVVDEYRQASATIKTKNRNGHGHIIGTKSSSSSPSSVDISSSMKSTTANYTDGNSRSKKIKCNNHGGRSTIRICEDDDDSQLNLLPKVSSDDKEN